MVEKERAQVFNQEHQNNSLYSAHAHASPTFVEKVTVYHSLTNYKAQVLTQPLANGDELAQTFKLTAL
jgi:hypothetical protein